jgi:hypothetical protein
MRLSSLPSIALAEIAVLSLTACVSTHTPVKQVKEPAPSEVSAPSKAARLRLAPVSFRLYPGERIGEDGQGPGCLVHPGNEVKWKSALERPVGNALNRVLLAEIGRAGYAAAPDDNVGRNGDGARDVRVAGRVTKITLNTCYPGSISPVVNLARGGRGDAYGEAYVLTEWTIGPTAGSERRVITEGSAKIDEPAPGNVRILEKAFAVAVRRLLADSEFRTLEAGDGAQFRGR